MKPAMSLKIAKTAIQEIRLLLRSGNYEQALEIAEALRNLPLTQDNEAQSHDIEKSLVSYFNKHPDRKKLSHWDYCFHFHDKKKVVKTDLLEDAEA